MYTPTVKELQDQSKNLISGDFEKQFSDAKEKDNRQWLTWLIGVVIFVCALVMLLIPFTIVREVQIRHLRLEIDALTSKVIAVTEKMTALKEKIDNNKFFNDFQDLQDTIYADEDVNGILYGKEDVKDKSYDSLEKLHGLTVLEDDSLGDDEDPSEDDDAESGFWYPDYDKRAEHIGSTNMVHLRPEDFVEMKSGGEHPMIANLRELKRRLNENPEDPNLPALAPKSFTTEPSETRDKRSVFPDSSADSVDEFAAPRFTAKIDERRKTKKYTSDVEPTGSSKMALHTVTRTIRNSDYGVDYRRPFVAAHFHGNTSHLSPELHDHYKGNGLVRVSHGSAHDVWYPAPWTIKAPRPRPTLTKNSHVHVHDTGVYLIYVQIYYLDSHDIISWVLHRTNAEIEGRETILQCAQSTHSTEQMDKPNSCFSASAVFLKAGDRLAVRNTGGDRHSLMQPEKSFIGLIKLADAEDPTLEL